MNESLANYAVSHALAYLATIRERTVRATLGGDELRDMLGGPLPARGEDPIRVIDTLAEAGRTGTVASQGPRYFGFVTGGSIPAAIAADWLVTAWDQNAQMFVMSPISAVVEQIVSEWLKQLFGLPATWSVGFVTGAQMANFTALLTARHQLLRQLDWDVERHGLFGAQRLTLLSATNRIGRSSRRSGCSASVPNEFGVWKSMHRAGCARIVLDRSCEVNQGPASCVRRSETSIRAPLIPSKNCLARARTWSVAAR